MERAGQAIPAPLVLRVMRGGGGGRSHLRGWTTHKEGHCSREGRESGR